MITIRLLIPVSQDSRISCVSWLLLIKLFELEVSARKANVQLGLSYPTTLKGFDILRNITAKDAASRSGPRPMMRSLSLHTCIRKWLTA